VASAFGGSLVLGGRFCVGASRRNLAAVTVKMFSHLSQYFIKRFCKFCTFNAIYKDNAAINCIIVQHKKVISRQRVILR
jgi:biotin synthase-like enzyme